MIIVKRYFFFIIMLLIITLFVPTVSAIQVNAVQKNNTINILHTINHHKGTIAEVELGYLILYFEQEAMINTLRHVAYGPDKEEQIFFLPKSLIKADLPRHFEDDGHRYTIDIQPVEKPIKGIKIIVHYNPAMVGIGYDMYDSINLQKAIVFRLYNKKLLKEIHEKERGVLRTAMRNTLPVVIIDCGHGGSDIGTVGCTHHTQEKDVCLHIGNTVAQLLAQNKVKVGLTRTVDTTCSLDVRTTYANARHADVFVSIHANAAPNTQANGLETYYPDDALLKKKFCSLDEKCHQCYQQLAGNRSKNSLQLAQSVHTSVLAQLKTYGYVVKDRTVKCALSQVLVGTSMPAILIEVGFLSNEQEEQRLKQRSYQYKLAQGIAHGIMQYIKQISL